MRTLLSLALSLAVFVPHVSAQTATPPAPPGGVGAGPAPVQGEVPAVPAPALPPPVVVSTPAAAPSAAPVPAVSPEATAPVPAAPPAPPASTVPEGSAPAPQGAAQPLVAVPVAPPPGTVLAPLPPHSRTLKRPVTTASARPPVPQAAPKNVVRGDAGAPFAVAVGGGFVWNDDVGYRLVGDKRRPQFDVMASYDLLQPSKHLVVSLGASLRRAHADEDDLSIVDNTVQGELVARLATPSWFWPHARASVGAAFTRVELRDDGVGGTLRDRDTGLASSFGGGFTLRTPTRALETAGGRFASLSFGVLCEAGYALAKDATFTATPTGGESDVQRGAVRLGTLSRNAPYLRIMAIMRF